MVHKTSSKEIYLGWGITAFLLFIGFAWIAFWVTDSRAQRLILLLFALLFELMGIVVALLLRRRITHFSDSMNDCLDDMINRKENIAFDLETETLMAKLQNKLKRLYEIMDNDSLQNAQERATIQSLVSDISHQVKTPIANIKMYNEILQGRSMSPEKQEEFLQATNVQINKLDFLMQSMIKMSRLETGMIEIKPQPALIYNTLADALGGVLLKVENKNIDVCVDCDPALMVKHDTKWTSEALFNLLDNAAKYTKCGGKITVTVSHWDFYTKIDISDTGKGISENHQAAIFKRFYREADVHNQEGIGIGLYLTREIISIQSGYIKVQSEPGKGSTFSVFLPN